MTHIGKESRFKPVGKFRLFFHFLQLLDHLFPFRIIDRYAGIAGNVPFQISLNLNTGDQ